MDNTVSSIPRCAFLLVSFPLQSAVENMSAIGLQPETIVSRLLLKLGGRLAHSKDSYWKIGTARVALILSGMATNLPGSRVPLGRGLGLATPTSLLKPPTFSMLKSPDFSRKELSVR